MYHVASSSATVQHKRGQQLLLAASMQKSSVLSTNSTITMSLERRNDSYSICGDLGQMQGILA